MACGYALTSPTIAGDLTLFPVNFVWESDTKGVDEAILRNTTQKGFLYDYELYNQDVIGVTFRFSSTQYSTFETFIDATRALDFWFVPDSSNMSAKYHVRRAPSILPKAMAPIVYSSTLEQRFEWTLQMTVVIEDQELED